MFFNALWDFFVSGGGVSIGIISVCSVGVVFVVTFVAGLISTETAAADKRFFLWFAELGSLAVVGCAALDFLSAKSFGIKHLALILASTVMLFLFEYGILKVQACVAKFILRRKESREKGQGFTESAVAECRVENIITPLKRVKTAKIKEVVLRKTERRVMEKGFETRLGRAYVGDCINRLRGKALSCEDGRTVDVIEHNLAILLREDREEDSVAISENCGRLITLLAKYSK